MKRRLSLLTPVLLLLGLILSMSNAGASTGSAAQPAKATSATALPSHALKIHGPLRLIPANSGAFIACDTPSGTNPILCLNDSGYGCTDSTPVLGWQDVKTANEFVYEISHGSYVTLNFQSCGNNWTIWQYGFGGSGNYLYMHSACGSCNNDLFYITGLGGNQSTIRNKGDNQYMSVGTNQGNQVYTGGFAGGYSEWSSYPT